MTTTMKFFVKVSLLMTMLLQIRFVSALYKAMMILGKR